MKENLEVLNYSGIFLSCFSNNHTSCVPTIKDHTLIYLCSGEHTIVENNQKIILKPGESAFVRKNHRLTMFKNYGENGQYKGISITFQRKFLREFFNAQLKHNKSQESINPTHQNVFKLNNSPDLKSLFESLTPYFDSGVEPTKDLIQLKLQEGIHILLKTNMNFYPILFDFTEPWKIDILEFLNENYTYDLSISEIASYTGRSLATFKRDFSKISHLPPQKWLINKRLEAAYETLKSSKIMVNDLYTEVGFKNLSHFQTAFKKKYGFTPASFHKSGSMKR